MSIIEKLQREDDNAMHIFLYANKGVFANAYEKSAYSLIKSGFQMKTNVSYNRKLKQHYVSIGLPVDKVEQYLEGKFKYTKTSTNNDTVYEITLPMSIFSEEEYESWKKSLLFNKEKATVIPSSDCNNDVIQSILNLSLADISPMEAMNFLNKIQQQLRHERK